MTQSDKFREDDHSLDELFLQHVVLNSKKIQLHYKASSHRKKIGNNCVQGKKGKQVKKLPQMVAATNTM